jgi:hypothetical protein
MGRGVSVIIYESSILNGHVGAYALLYSHEFCSLQDTMIGVGHAVCVPPSPAFTSLTVTVKGDNSSADNCQIQPCLLNNCTCRKIFAYEACGTLSIPLAINVQNYQVGAFGGYYVQNQQHVAWWLSTLGLTSVQTLLKDLSITIDVSRCTEQGCTGGLFMGSQYLSPAGGRSGYS